MKTQQNCEGNECYVTEEQVYEELGQRSGTKRRIETVWGRCQGPLNVAPGCWEATEWFQVRDTHTQIYTLDSHPNSNRECQEREPQSKD